MNNIIGMETLIIANIISYTILDKIINLSKNAYKYTKDTLIKYRKIIYLFLLFKLFKYFKLKKIMYL